MLIRLLAALVPVALVAVVLGMLYTAVLGHISSVGDSQPAVSNTSECTSDTFLGVCLDGASGH